MKIDRKQLQQALEVVKPGLANKESIDQSTSFAFLGGRVVTYNDEISLSHPVEGLKLEGAIRADELYGFLRKTGEETIKAAVSENEIKFKAGKTKAGLRLEQEITLPINETGSIEESDWNDLPEEFSSNLNFIKDSASNDMGRAKLTCIHVDKNMMEASNGQQIMQIFFKDPFAFPNTLIPAQYATNITKIEPYQVAQTPGWLHFRNRDHTTIISCRILPDDYPETSDHMEVEGKKLVFPDTMSAILDRVMVFTEEDDLMKERMEILLKNNKLLVKGENSYGWIKEKEKVKYEGDKASFWINPRLLQNILNRSNTCLLGTEKIKFKGKDWQYIAVLQEPK